MKLTWLFRSLALVAIVSVLTLCAAERQSVPHDHAVHYSSLMLSDDGKYYSQTDEDGCWEYVQGAGGDVWTSSDRPAPDYFKPGTWKAVRSLPSSFIVCDSRAVGFKDGKPTGEIKTTQ